MASPNVMPTASTTGNNSDLPHQPSLCSSLSTLLTDLQNQNILPFSPPYLNESSSIEGAGATRAADDEVWAEEEEAGMSLEDYLTKAGAVREEDVMINNKRSRRRRRGGEEGFPVDKATQQKRRRMIKNRESAARSRERKQAYMIELESLVSQLEEENARLRTEQVQQSKERFKEMSIYLIADLIYVINQSRKHVH
ncbi:bZIP transcription factor 12-like isoform X2 [Mercurialis annua]|uniref:bZIP transcription factor 12-like isoform X2 n=1 Tax=Mercurialis annua TaxID=3986 RepID=UPI00215F7956|nr:bZIP transcription factor 12-like isoform X2 [Mercurialis annua]